MIAFDTDVLTAILLGNPALVQRAAAFEVREQAVPVIVIEEIMRGRLNVIRQAEAGRANVSIPRAMNCSRKPSRIFAVSRSFHTRLKQTRCTNGGGNKASVSPRTTCASLPLASRMPPY